MSSTSRIHPILAQLMNEVGNCEKAVLARIQNKKEKRAMSNTVMDFNKTNTQLKRTPIAIIGMASIFPESENLQAYWENILNEVDCITEVPPSRWDVDAYYDPDPKAPDKTYCKRGGFIPDIDFNPMEFGLPPNILEFTDVSQLLSLVVAKKAMEDAGYGETKQFNRDSAGVILGAAVGRQLSGPFTARMQYPVWERVLRSSGISDGDIQRIVEKMKLAYLEWEENAFPGMLSNVIAGRIANRLDFGGTNCAIDAACASSLSAFKMAVSELLENRCDIMLTGGVDTDNSIVTYLCFSKTPALSRRQEIRPFDADSDGMMLGEGIGMVVLKRLEDAERDGDRIYAVVRGIGSSSDGRYKSIYAPRPEGQARALRRAYEEADFSPATIGLIEAHGTGTGAGDPAEFESLKQVFGEATARKQSIALGSVKSQIGHTKAAAGAASMIKAVLALHHKILPATLNVAQPNPKLGIEATPFYLNTTTRPWIRAEGASPRRAGVSSFGFGGTNFHVVLEEYEADHQCPYRLHATVQPLLLAAPTVEQLLDRCQEALTQLKSKTGELFYRELVKASQAMEIPPTSARLGFVASSRTEACTFLETSITALQKQPKAESWSHPQGVHYRKTGMALTGKVVALFSGQGSQYLNMGRELALNFPDLRQGYAAMDRLFLKDGLEPLSNTVFPPPVFEAEQKETQTAALNLTEYAQPAIGVFSTALYKILQQAGLKPDFVAGHSFGELTALWAAGALSDADYCALVKARGQAMATPKQADFDAGTMLAVKGDANQVETLIKDFPEVTIANFNSNRQVVLAGAKAAIHQVQQRLQEQGFSVVPLSVSAAFHTPLVAHARTPFAQTVETITFNEPTVPVYTNVTGKRYPNEPAAIQGILKDHLISRVLFRQEIETIYADGGSCFIEFGPKNVLTNLVKEILGDKPHVAIALNANRQKDSDRQLHEAVTQLRVIGLSLKHADPYQLEQKAPALAKPKVMNVRLNASNYVSEKKRLAFETALQDGHLIKFPGSQPEAIPVSNGAISIIRDAVTVANGTGSKTREPVAVANGTGSVTNGTGSKTREPVTVANGTGSVTNGAGSKTIEAVVVANGTDSISGKAGSVSNGGSSVKRENSSASSGVIPTSPLINRRAPSHSHTLLSPSVAAEAQKDSPSVATKKSQPTHQAGAVMVLENTSPNPGSPVNFSSNRAQTLTASKSVADTSKHHFSDRVLAIVEKTLNDKDPSKPLDTESSTISGTQAILPSSEGKLAKTAQGKSLPVSTRQTSELKGQPMSHSSSDYQRLLESLEYSLTQFKHYQGDLLSTHEQYLNQHIDYAQAVLNLTQQQCSLLADGLQSVNQPDPTKSAVVESLDRSMSQFHQHHAETLRVHQQVLNHQTEHAQHIFQTVHQQYSTLLARDAASLPEPVAIPTSLLERPFQATNGNGSKSMPQQKPVAEPAARNGSESVQAAPAILSNVEVTRVETSNIESANIETTHIEVTNLESTNGKASNAEVTNIEITHVEVTHVETTNIEVTADEAATITPALASGIEVEALSQALLSVVSDKTGYPAEMLELDLDMEADLGIDSIKRVEILGAMQDKFPDYPAPNPEDLGELRTLRQIIEQMQQYSGEAPASTTDSVAAVAVTQAEPATLVNSAAGSELTSRATDSARSGVLEMEVSLPPQIDSAEPRFSHGGSLLSERSVSVTNTQVAIETTTTAKIATADVEALNQTLLSVVSDKTGYPAEMLELDLDMEADLGIDSIKRVEILGAMQDKFPDYPVPNSEDLGELRTLRQIIDQMSLLTQPAEKKTAQNPVPVGHSL